MTEMGYGGGGRALWAVGGFYTWYSWTGFQILIVAARHIHFVLCGSVFNGLGMGLLAPDIVFLKLRKSIGYVPVGALLHG